MNNTQFSENERKYSNIKLIKTERRNYLVSELNYHATNTLREHLLVPKMKRP